MRKLLVVLAALTAALGISALASARPAAEIMAGAKLTAAQEVPHPKAPKTAKGSFTGTIVGRKITWRLTFSGLSGPATAAHIHTAAKGKPGPVAVPLCGPCKTGAHGKATLTAAVLSKIKKGLAYVNVHTTKNPGGEIRGQLSIH